MRRTEFPDPQKRRADWQCLNGAWEFEIDNEKAGLPAAFYITDWRLR